MDQDAPSIPDQEKASEENEVQDSTIGKESSRGRETVESTSSLGQFLAELKRRRVMRVAASSTGCVVIRGLMRCWRID